MAHNYSRLASVEEKKNIKKATRIIALTIIVLIALVFWGIPTLGRLAGFVSDIAKGDKPITKSDNTPPAPPQIEIPPKYTNQNGLTIVGQSEVGAVIKLVINNQESEMATDKDGKFQKDISLLDGENIIYAKAIDLSGNESVETQKYTIIFDNKKPEINIAFPQDGANFYGNKQKQVQIVGTTEPGASVYINSRFVNVKNDVSFEFNTMLSEGENNFNIKSTDLAGNTTEMDLKVNFTP